jgi:hypothetical protein
MHKQYEEEPRRIEHEDDATITFTVALHGPHAWEILLEDSRRYHSISHGWATDDPRDWEDAIAPVLRKFFAKRNTRASDTSDTKSMTGHIVAIPKGRMVALSDLQTTQGDAACA